MHKKVFASALRIMQGGQPLPPPLARATATIVADEWIRKGKVSLQADGAILIDSHARKDAKWIKKRLSWMNDPRRCHGQQAEQHAQKTIRGILNGHADYEDVMRRCQLFRSLRGAGIRRERANSPWAPAWELKLWSCDGRASRLRTDTETLHVGHTMENCLGDPGFRQIYADEMRSGELKLLVIECKNFPQVAMSIRGDVGDQVKGVGNIRPILWREPIIEVLLACNGSVGECRDLLEIGICDELLQARNFALSQFYNVEGWELEVGPGFLSGVSGETSILVRSRACFEHGCPVAIVGPNSDWTEYCEQARMRQLVRLLQCYSTEFAAAMRTAFADTPREFREDFGIGLRERKFPVLG